jgi:hypothetical protein
MIQYDTRLTNRPPIAPAVQAEAMAAMRSMGPQAGNAADVYGSVASERAAQYARAADMANMQYAAAQQKAQQGLALQGLSRMDAEQQAARQHQNSLAGSLLGGLYREYR